MAENRRADAVRLYFYPAEMNLRANSFTPLYRMISLPNTGSPASIADHKSAAAIFDHTRPRRGSAEIDSFLNAVVRLGASDLHLKAGE